LWKLQFLKVLIGLFSCCWWFQIPLNLARMQRRFLRLQKWFWMMSFLLRVSTSCSKVQRTLLAKVSCLHVIFDLNGVLVAKHAFRTHMWLSTNSLFTFMPGLKDFLTNCLVQFGVYIWFATQRYNINKYLDKIRKKQFFFGSFESSWTKVLPEKWLFSCYLSQKN